MKKIILYTVLAIAALLILNIEVDHQYAGFNDLSGKVVFEPKEKIINYDENIEIQKDELKECCSFIDEKGDEKSCFALGSFSCDYCNAVC